MAPIPVPLGWTLCKASNETSQDAAVLSVHKAWARSSQLPGFFPRM